ncbi:hypothetical protein Goklo_021045 [Gossypium klotzschianum]|uniref:MLO-like protein n=1 Tax=Gossypium klotzschianum TaxID=34286 RepID=A0A7J8UTZ2_9ROSI|nr:hypothetical protein [Gossypium klotzschianum]
MAEGGGEGESLEYTPTWVLAVICTVIIAISLAIEQLMLLGFISLLLTVFQSAISKICMSKKLVKDMLPCKIEEEEEEEGDDDDSNATTSHFQTYFASTMSGGTRHLLAKASSNYSVIGYCGAKDKVPLLSVEALHHMHIFIFVLAIAHVIFCVLTVSFGGLKIRKWKQWEDEIRKEDEGVLEKKVTHVHQHDFIKDRFLGFGKDLVPLAWLNSFIKQFYASVTKSDYEALRLGFIMMHCRGNPKFNFHKYMIRALEDDFEEVVGIRPVIFLMLLLAVGTKLEHVITKLAHEVAEKHVAVEGELVVKPSNEHFWVFIQVLCSYSTLPLYAIVAQMGSMFNKAIFEDHVQASLLGWAKKVKKKNALKQATELATKSTPRRCRFRWRVMILVQRRMIENRNENRG